MSLLGIDVGTSGCKTVAFSEDGQALASAYREYATQRPEPGWAELDSREVWECVRKNIAEVAASVRNDPVGALCVSSMGEATTPVSLDRRVLGPCILSSDTRGSEYIRDLERSITQEEFYGVNPNVLGVSYSLPKLLWLRQHRPELYRQADKFLLWADFVAFMLGCDPVTDYSLANRTLLFDIHRQDWSDQLLALTGIERVKLPSLLPSGSLVGTVPDFVARELNLPGNVAVVVGGHDQCCNALGAGVYRAGKTVCGIGTFECITPAFDHIPPAAPMLANGLNTEHHVLPNLFVSFIYNQSGCLVRWFRDTFASADCRLRGSAADIYDRLAIEMPDAPTRLFALPYFDITGPPGFVDNASGVILGLKTSTSRGEILKSIMESVTFYFAESIKALKDLGIDSSEFIATGGGAKSDRWLQIKADILGVPFVRPHITEASILGTVILAGTATGVFHSPAEGVTRFVKRDKVFEPNPHRHQLYQEKLQEYREIFPLLREFLAKHEEKELHRFVHENRQRAEGEET
jgi:xylulokinase